MSTSVAPHSTVRVGGSSRGAQRAVLGALILVAVAIAKPWGSGPNLATPALGPDASATTANTDASNTPTAGALTVVQPEPSLGPNEIRCLHGFEVVSLVNLGTWNVREWLPVEPAPASGPLDPRLTVVMLDGGPVRALGACVGRSDGVAPDVRIVGAWRVGAGSPGTRKPVRLVELPRSAQLGADAHTANEPSVDDSASPLARLYRPATIAPHAPWPNGAYVVEVADSSAPDGVRWLRLAIGPIGASG